MTSPRPHIVDPQLVARLSDEFTALGRQLGSVGQDLAALRTQLDAAARPQYAPPQYVPPRPQQMPRYTPPQYIPPQRPPAPQQTWTPQPRVAPRTPWWQRDGVISRLLAVAGAGVTLIGVVLLLVLAAQAGFFGPVARVAAGGALSAGLVVVGVYVFGRAGGRVGGIALVATGIAGAYLDVVAMTTVYEWVAAPLGLLIALVVCGGGIAIAAKWQAQTLALLTVSGVALLAPFVTGGITLTLIGFLIVMQISCYPVQLLRPWPFLHIARTVPVVFALLVAIAAQVVGDSDRNYSYWLLASSVVVAAFGLSTAISAVWRTATDYTASAMFGAAAVPLLLITALFERAPGAIIEGSFAAVLLVVAVLRMLPAHTRIAAVGVSVLALLQACVLATEVQTLPIALLVVAIGFVAVSGQVRSKFAYFLGLGFAVVGGLAYLGVASPEALSSPARAVDDLGSAVVIAGLLGIATVVLLGWQANRLALVARGSVETFVVLGGLCGLYAMTAATVAAGVAIGGTDGFTAGHCVSTIAWMVAATVLLLRGLKARTNVQVILVAGLSLTGAALAKLFLFDLATLDGLLRVAAFIAVGLLLLVAGTMYAKAFAEREQQASAGSLASAGR
ncbi:DUF2339 domain-containing protein [Antrihabitans stalactiti]|uniref:DUF2339 domain-containing protein n=1 Tax=Antrihabitans stalactiti TaxID=2584121 RepID=A0A848KD75_9NOCA|nr:DUF2339 domain-containing protein [Antrihabitans stalactiti]NMN95686.1 DUF2339 domain-containing protein [Antrihabitans stalactiti]